MKGTVELVRAQDDIRVAQIATERWLADLKIPCYAAFSGGRIAIKFFAALALRSEGKLRQEGIHVFFADERCVPPDNPESNFRLVNEHLIRCGAIRAEQVHRIAGENDPHEAAQDAARELDQACSGLLDIVFLGMGEDGHVASLFPNDPELDAAAVYRPVLAPKPPPRRITLGLSVILAARQVWVLASGTGKEKALADSLCGAGMTPLGRVIAGREHTLIITNIG